MKWHVLHPLWVAIGLVAVIFIARIIMVPDDFGVHGASFTYGYHRFGNVEEWQDFPLKYQGKESCAECHEDNYRSNRRSPHKRVECENCHGPAVDHPDGIEFLPLNTERQMCLRCHASLDYPNNARAEMPTIRDRTHKRRRECIECHDPHDPRRDVE